MDIFAQATAVAQPTTKAKKKKEKPIVEIGNPLNVYAAIVSLTKTLETVAATMGTEIKAKMLDTFTDQIVDKGVHENVQGDSKDATASLELRRRSSASVLTDEEVEILKKNEISYDVQTVREEQFYFNPEILADQAALKAISEALGDLPELKGRQVLLKQVKTTKNIVSDDTFKELGEAAKNKKLKRKQVSEILQIIGTMAIKPAMKKNDIEIVYNILKEEGITFGDE